MCSSEELGRYLVAVRDLSPGDLILTENPLVFAPKAMPNPEAVMACVGCYKPVFTDVGERCPKYVYLIIIKKKVLQRSKNCLRSGMGKDKRNNIYKI